MEACPGITVSEPRFKIAGKIASSKNLNSFMIEQFNPEHDSLQIELDLSLNTIANLFYPHPRAVATPNSTLGIGLFWESRNSSHRGVGSINSITASKSKTHINLTIQFASGSLRGEIFFGPKLFLMRKGGELPGFCSIEGGILGEIGDQMRLIVDGNGSKFPIHETNEGSKAPLWRVQMDWFDALQDSFNEHFKIFINADHPDFQEINLRGFVQSKSNRIPLALKEILTSTLFGMMLKLKSNQSDWDAILEGRAAQASVGDLAWCYVQHMRWNVSSPEILLHDIRKSLDKEGSS